MTRYELDAVDASFFTTARHRIVLDLALRAPAEQVWAGLTQPRPLQWCRALSGVAYVGDGPYGVGALRNAVAGRVLRLQERYFLWDDAARRQAFFVETSNVPLFRAFAEDSLVTPEGSGCRLTWSFAFEGTRRTAPLVAAGLPGTRLLCASFARDTRRRFGDPRTQ